MGIALALQPNAGSANLICAVEHHARPSSARCTASTLVALLRPGPMGRSIRRMVGKAMAAAAVCPGDHPSEHRLLTSLARDLKRRRA